MLGAHGGHVGRAQPGPSVCDGLSTRRPPTACQAPPTHRKRAWATLQPQTWVLSWMGHSHPARGAPTDLGHFPGRAMATLLRGPTDLGHSPGQATATLLGGCPQTWVLSWTGHGHPAQGAHRPGALSWTGHGHPAQGAHRPGALSLTGLQAALLGGCPQTWVLSWTGHSHPAREAPTDLG